MDTLLPHGGLIIKLDRFTSVISHDLRNPLNAAAGRLELARDRFESEDLDTAAVAIDRSQTMIDDLLTLAPGGDGVSDSEWVELADATEACWQDIATGEATLVTETNCLIDANSRQLRQLLQNPVQNAVEHGGEGVTVSIGELDDDTGFYVADDGAGISPDEQEQVFEFGYSTAEGGTGFGLSIVRGLAEAHDWEIRVTDSPDGGARFEITDVEIKRSNDIDSANPRT
jgi:signal transduction histidine kinase